MENKLKSNEMFDSKVTSRFLDKLKIGDIPENCPTPCIEWTGHLNKGGYGNINIGGRKNRTTVKAHRWAIGFAMGGVILPPEIKACHICDNPACVTPTHLFLGTQQDNVVDKTQKGRAPIVFGNAKLNWNIVDDIRTSDLTGKTLAEKHNVSKGTISDIRNNKIWKEENREKAMIS